MEPTINFVAVLVAALISMIIGSLWYSPLLFGNAWMKAMGIKMKKMDAAAKSAMMRSYILMFISALVMNFILAHFVDYTDSVTFMQGMTTGAWLWLGFIATVSLGTVLWEQKPVRLYFINVLYYLVTLLITGGILAVWV